MRVLLVAAVLIECGGGQGLSDGGQDAGSDAGESGADAGPSCQFPSAFYRDADGDGYGSKLAASVLACVQPVGYVGNQLDCADGDARAKPGGAAQATAIVGATAGGLGFDFDCDGDEDPQATAWAPCSGTSYCSGQSNAWREMTYAPCGLTWTWVVTCSSIGGICQPTNSEQRTQSCR